MLKILHCADGLLGKPWAEPSWVGIFTQGPFQRCRSHASISLAKIEDCSICKMGCDFEADLWFSKHLPWPSAACSQDSTLSGEQLSTYYSEGAGWLSHFFFKKKVYTSICMFLMPIYLFIYLIYLFWIVNFLKTRETFSKSAEPGVSYHCL